MSINFLYVDDDKVEELQPIIEELQYFSNGRLKIEHVSVKPMRELTNKFSDGGYDGIIIDQKLDAADEEGNTVDYWGTSLAQNFRTEMIGKIIRKAPIILLSNEDVYVQYYNSDESAKNLFDCAVAKKRIAEDQEYAEDVSLTIIGLSEAYKMALYAFNELDADSVYERLQPLFQWDEEIYDAVDVRLVEYLTAKSEDVHTIVSTILKNVVNSNDILVDEALLATRLGVDIAEYNECWNDLKQELSSFKYEGVFSDYKPRWWWSRIEDWWAESVGISTVLRALPASERVSILNNYLNANGLYHIRPKYSGGTQSEKYWVNCVVSGTPLDPYDALLAKAVDRKPWEQPIYLDATVVYNREHKPEFNVHSDSQRRVEPLYKRLRKYE